MRCLLVLAVTFSLLTGIQSADARGSCGGGGKGQCPGCGGGMGGGMGHGGPGCGGYQAKGPRGGHPCEQPNKGWFEGSILGKGNCGESILTGME